MKEWVRRQIDQLCHHLQDTITGTNLSNDIPQPLNYGQSGDAGTSPDASRSDHRHALDAAIYGALPTEVLDICTLSTSQNTNLKVFNFIFGSATGLASDSPGLTGAFGMEGVDFSIGGAGTNSHVAMSNSSAGSAAGDRSLRVHSVNRMANLILRARCRGTSTPSDHKAALGGYHETTGGVTPDIDSMDDFLGFFIQRDSSGVGNFRAMAKSSTTGQTTDIDLGIGWSFLTTGEFMNFAIQYDLTTASFFIDGVHYADITDNIPTQKIWGWGLVAEKSVATPSAREIWLDDIIFLGRF